MDLITVGVALLLTTVAVYLFLTRRTWLGQHMPLPLHPSSPRPGTIPRMARGVRSSVR